ncbi:DUF1987 domain-containing protein [Carboxylicivirga caseinilyticus]|uniref:DUF1987 domain-containing protein n=1 Tax=Carboxylicivirga caseinilyticus TaxID=3417572 RepID=UPI003D351261|nr:DUF1987 domain-containing protein [Marinilabiliaceae bacterium A049]
MDKIVLKEPTRTTPFIKLDYDHGLIEFKGKLTPENCSDLFDPIIQWIDEYIDHPLDKTELNIQLEYFNTRSSIYLLDIFRKFESLTDKNRKIIINWICESDDFDMIEAGEDYQAIINIPINIIEFN